MLLYGDKRIINKKNMTNDKFSSTTGASSWVVEVHSPPSPWAVDRPGRDSRDGKARESRRTSTVVARVKVQVER